MKGTVLIKCKNMITERDVTLCTIVICPQPCASVPWHTFLSHLFRMLFP